jgi:sugar (pentulose or hexulose) kinase
MGTSRPGPPALNPGTPPNADQPAYCHVGVDLGTSGCRAVAIDDAGRIRAGARTRLPPSRRIRNGYSEQRPQDWWSAFQRVLTELLQQDPGKVRSICVDGTSSTLLLSDSDGVPLNSALMYDDRRAAKQARQIARIAPIDSPSRGPGSALAKLLYRLSQLAHHGRCHALHQADWIAGRLLGRFDLTDENNALKLGYDPVARCWPQWMERLSIPDGVLPSVQPIGTVYGAIRRAAAEELGLPHDVTVVAGTTDSNAAALAAGITDPGDAVSSLGSTLALKVLSERPLASAQYGIYSHRLGDTWLVGGASNSGGAVLRRYFEEDEIARRSQSIDPERPLDLHYYPLNSTGERFPRNDPDLRARLHPRPTDPTRFLQGLLEGIADIEAEGYARLAELGAPYPRRVFSSGGGANNAIWQRMRERRLGVPVTIATQTEAAYGAARLARDALA